MENVFENFIEKLITECLQGAKFAYLTPKEKDDLKIKLRNHFMNVTLDTLVDQMSDEQLVQVKDLDPNSPEMQQKMVEFAAIIPGFAIILDDKLKKEMDNILQTGQIPE